MTDSRNHRNMRCRHRPHDDFIVKAPEIFKAAAATRHDQHIRPRNCAIFGQGIKPFNRCRHFGTTGFPLHAHWPDNHMQRITIRNAVNNIANDRTRRRCHNANHARHERQKLLCCRIEKTFRSKPSLALFEKSHQSARACGLHLLDDDLIFGRARIGCQFASGNDFHPLFWAKAQTPHGPAPDHSFQPCAIVLQSKIGMTRRMRATIAGNLAAHAHMRKRILDRPLQSAGNLGNAILRYIRSGAAWYRIGTHAHPIIGNQPALSVNWSRRRLFRLCTVTNPASTHCCARDGCGQMGTMQFQRKP
ncbi:hypothetical protein D3C80_1268730 [compost metagenome]